MSRKTKHLDKYSPVWGHLEFSVQVILFSLKWCDMSKKLK